MRIVTTSLLNSSQKSAQFHRIPAHFEKRIRLINLSRSSSKMRLQLQGNELDQSAWNYPPEKNFNRSFPSQSLGINLIWSVNLIFRARALRSPNVSNSTPSWKNMVCTHYSVGMFELKISYSNAHTYS